MRHPVIGPADCASDPGRGLLSERLAQLPHEGVERAHHLRQQALARRFGQLGTLSWRRGEPIRLRMYTTRPVAVEAHDQIDWLGAMRTDDQRFG